MAWNQPPNGPPSSGSQSYQGYPPQPGGQPGFTYMPTPVVMPIYPTDQINTQPGYPPQQNSLYPGYPPQQSGYPPQQNNMQPCYPPQPGYPLQLNNMQPGYPPQQNNMQPGYPPQQNNMQPGYPPQQNNMHPGYPSQQVNMQPPHVNHPPPQAPATKPVVGVENSQHQSDVIHWVPADMKKAKKLKKEALVIGKEAWGGSPLWAIRSHHSGHLIPGKLVTKEKAAFIPHIGKELPVHNFEVLCAPSEAVQWLPATSGNVPTNAIISGNTDTGEPLFLGRARHKGCMTPGKVQGSKGGIFIPCSGREVLYDTYEVLCRVDGY